MLQLRTGNRIQRRRAKKHSPRLTAVQAVNQETLMLALQNAVPGTVIELASGEYGNLNLHAVFNPHLKYQGDYVTIKSAEGRGAVFENIVLYNTSYLRFDSITVQKTAYPGEPLQSKAFWVYGPRTGGVNASHNIQIVNSEISGTDDDDYTNDTYGLYFEKVDNVLVQNNVFHDLSRATMIFSGDDIDVINNEYYDIEGDAMNFAGVHDVLIEGNMGINWHPDAQRTHADFIQFWTNSTDGGSSGVTIRGNLCLDGPGYSATIPKDRTAPQGIFIRDSANYGIHDFLIENNFIFTRTSWGITVEPGTGTATNIVVRNNTVLYNVYDIPGKPSGLHPVIHLQKDVASGLIENNVTSFPVVSDNAALIGDNNVVVSLGDRFDQNYVGDVFINPFGLPLPNPINSPADAKAFLPVPGSAIAGLGAYALLESLGAPPAYIAAAPDADASDPASSLTVTLSAEDYTVDGIPGGGNVTFEWDFGDGSPTSSGQTVDHTFAEAGAYTVTLTITDPDTSFEFTTERVVKVVGPLLLNLTFENTLDNLGDVQAIGAWDGTPSYAVGEDGYAASFTGAGGPRVTITADADHLSKLAAFTVYFEFRLNGTETARPVWSEGGGYGANIGPTTANFYLTTTDTPGTWITSTVSNLGTTWHAFLATYDMDAGVVNIYVDGGLVKTQSGFVGPAKSTSGRLFVGGFGGSSFDGLVENLRLIGGVVPPADMATFLAQYA